MATELSGTPAVETPAPTEIQADEQPTQEVVAPEATDDAGEPKSTEGEKSPELKRLERELKKAQRVNSKLYQELGSLKERVGTETKEKEAEPQETDIDALVEYKAKVKEFTRTANQLVDQGTKAHSDYRDVLKDLAGEVGEFVKRDGTPTPFMEVVLEASDKPAELLYYLGKNPDIAAELADLSPIKLAKKLDRLERDLAESSKPATSKAPKPLETVKSHASSGPSPDGSYEDFLAWRKTNKGSWR